MAAINHLFYDYTERTTHYIHSQVKDCTRQRKNPCAERLEAFLQQPNQQDCAQGESQALQDRQGFQHQE